LNYDCKDKPKKFATGDLRETEDYEEIIINKEYEEIALPQTPTEFASMKKSIRKDGQLVRAVVNEDGVLLDGHHRYRACKEVGKPFRYEVKHFDDKLDEIWHIYYLNNERRHYNTFQKALQALRMEPYLVERARRNMSLAGKGDKILSRLERVNKELGKQAGMSHEQIRKVKHIINSEHFKENEEFRQACITAKKTITEAFNLIEKDEKRTKVKAEVEAAAKGLSLPEKVMFLNRDSRKPEEIIEIKDNSVDLIFTDPPYSDESLDRYEGLAKFASQKLVDGGSVVFFFGRQLLPDIMKIFEKYTNLKYWWVCAVKHEGDGKKIFPESVIVDWKPLLWFVKGDKRLTRSLMHDFIQSKKPDKIQHEWAQSPVEAEYIIKYLTISEDSLVVDPFLGSGAFAIPAIKLGRYFIGIDVDKEAYENAKNYVIKEAVAPRN
jgi:ParB-like chromosome segregation protein Spo0J